MWGSKLIPISLKLHKLLKLHTMATLQHVNELERRVRNPNNGGDPTAKKKALLILAIVRATFVRRRPVRIVPIQAPADPPVGPE